MYPLPVPIKPICKIQNYLRAAGRASLSSVELNTSKSEETEAIKKEKSEVKISQKKLLQTCYMLQAS
jgi:hypothetical protein